MTLFFIDKDAFKALSPRMSNMSDLRLFTMSDVVVAVGDDDKWRTLVDRRCSSRSLIHEDRRGYLLSYYHTVVRPISPSKFFVVPLCLLVHDAIFH